MGPQRRGEREPDQVFDADEKLYRRVPQSCLSPQGEVVASYIRCSFEREAKKSPSVIRSKYGSATDVLHRDCADDKDVSDNLVFYLVVGKLPGQVESGVKELYDFYPLHDPLDTCFAHTVIACRKHGGPEDAYDKPSRHVCNALKAQFVAAFERNRVQIPLTDC
jgi:hypothetical protein